MTVPRTMLPSGLLVARGYPPFDPDFVPPPPDPDPPTLPPSTRDDLIIGTYKPDAATTGVPSGTILKDYNSPTTDYFILPAGGGTIREKIVYGDFRRSDAASWNFIKCKFVGGRNKPTYASAICEAFRNIAGAGNASATNFEGGARLNFVDCSFIPRTPADGRDGIKGWGYTLSRCYFGGGLIDCAGSFIDPSYGSHVNNKILGCLMEGTGYIYPDRDHSDGSHNDLIQHQGGDGLHVIGNNLNHNKAIYVPGSQPYPAYPWMIDKEFGAGAGILLQNNTGAANNTAAKTIITDNYFSGGKFQAVFHANMRAQFFRNKFSPWVARRGSLAGSNFNGWHVWISSPSNSDIQGMQTNNTTNVTASGPRAGQLLVPVSLSGVAGLTWRTPNWPDNTYDW